MLPYVDYPFVQVAETIGASSDEPLIFEDIKVKLITSFLFSYPLAGLLKRIPDSKPQYKNLFIVGVSLFYLIGLFDLWSGLRTLLIDAIGVYWIAAKIRGPYMPWIGFVFLMGHMSINHIIRQSRADPHTVDITGAQMVLVMKLSAFCWNVHDGQLPRESLSEYQKERAIIDLPGLLDFAGYVFFFPALFAGPAFDYVEYRNWIETSMFEVPAGIDPNKRPRTRKKRKIPRSGTPAAFKVIEGLAWIFAFLKFSGRYHPKILAGDEYIKYGFLQRVWLMHMVGFTARMKYYGVWTLTEGACILSGLGYKGIDPQTGRVQWNRLQNISPWGVETAQNTRAYLENWNINTNHWLRNYIYLRVTPKGKKPGFRASLATFVTSAFWHGFYPGYYLTFVLASFLQTIAKNYRRLIRPFFLTPTGAPTAYKPFYDLLSYLCTQLSLSFAATPFFLLTLSDSFTAWSRVYFYTPIGIALSMAFFASPAKQYLVRLLEQRNRQDGTAGREKPIAVPVEDYAVTHDRMGKNSIMGLPSDLGRELDEVIKEVR
ncbi:MAG: lysophospholipid acyltransferase [Peltula sp. TS41687]|nr:MAG: lysophospholipid acyltransferase [Peltula sp. TS41687]